jgi:hypothetical protein
MPAIDLAHLKKQTALLSDQFGNPEAFLRALNELLEYYTNRTRRTAQSVQRFSLPTFHTPKPVLRQIEQELKAPADMRPVEAIALANALWKAGSMESRLLSARLLGMIQPAQALTAFSHLTVWLAVTKDKDIQHALLTDALKRLRYENGEAFFLLLEDWLKSPRRTHQVWGLQALLPLLHEPGFENLPAVFRIIRPAITMLGPSTQLELQTCLAALAEVSTTETIVFLREVLRSTPDPSLLRTLRRVMSTLPEKVQSGLRDTLREVTGTPEAMPGGSA